MRDRIFQAVSIDGILCGRIKDQRFTGSVHSVFDHAFSLDMDDLGLVTVISPRKPHGPAFIKACPFPSLRDALRPRTRAVLTHREVVFPSKGVRISLDDARHWAAMRDVTRPAGSDELAGRKSLLEEAAASRRGSNAGLERGIGSLSKAISSTDGAGIRAGLDALVGFGEGLTPAGDDVLLGMLCLCRSIPPETAGGRLGFFLERFSEGIGEYRGATTFISYSFLRYGSEGRFCEPLADLCRSVLSDGGECQDDARRLDKSMTGLLRIGATSGFNMLRGVVAGIEVYMEDAKKNAKRKMQNEEKEYKMLSQR